ncbi:hypothetical protein TIFTF001_051168, partial [Ficus carica]
MMKNEKDMANKKTAALSVMIKTRYGIEILFLFCGFGLQSLSCRALLLEQRLGLFKKLSAYAGISNSRGIVPVRSLEE